MQKPVARPYQLPAAHKVVEKGPEHKRDDIMDRSGNQRVPELSRAHGKRGERRVLGLQSMRPVLVLDLLRGQITL